MVGATSTPRRGGERGVGVACGRVGADTPVIAGSAADTPAASTGPQFVRVSDADRDQAIDELKQEFAVGRLSHETFMLRMQSALGARDRGQLAGLFTDLPPHGRLARLRESV